MDIDYNNTALTNPNSPELRVISYRGDQKVYLNDLNIKGSSKAFLAGIYTEQAYSQVILDGKINIDVSGEVVCGISGADAVEDNNTIVMQSDSVINIKVQGSKDSCGMVMAYVDLAGTLNVTVPTGQPSADYIEISASAESRINFSNNNYFGNVKFAAGAVVMIPDGVYQAVNNSEGFDIVQGADFQRIGDYDPSLLTQTETSSPKTEETVSAASFLQYQQILNQYDSLIKDASYKGINLLQDNTLNVKFNETGAAALSVNGKNMLSGNLGISQNAWKTHDDINQSIDELTSALRSLRSFSAELGNNYSIITSRQDFTESLINILTEGADKLTLADMNEESANMLALQTRQQLAVNSLSLASQASQSVLGLF